MLQDTLSIYAIKNVFLKKILNLSRTLFFCWKTQVLASRSTRVKFPSPSPLTHQIPALLLAGRRS